MKSAHYWRKSELTFAPIRFPDPKGIGIGASTDKCLSRFGTLSAHALPKPVPSPVLRVRERQLGQRLMDRN